MSEPSTDKQKSIIVRFPGHAIDIRAERTLCSVCSANGDTSIQDVVTIWQDNDPEGKAASELSPWLCNSFDGAVHLCKKHLSEILDWLD